MQDLPVITTFGAVPEFARGLVRDMRPRWACEEVGQPYTVKLIDFETVKGPDHKRVQPFGQVPTYRDDSGEIFESGAIVLHIAERAGQLLPEDARGRARALQWLACALNTIEPRVMALIINDVFEADQPWTKTRRPVVLETLNAGLANLAAALGDKKWLDGDTFTVGDLMMVSVLGGLRSLGVLEAHPVVSAYVERGRARPAHRKAMADHLAVFAEQAA